jgi:hypothetical protein
MQALVQTIQADPNVAQPYNEWTARVRWEGGFRAKALVRNHTLLIDEPADLVGMREALRYFDPSRVWLNPDCGFGTFAERPVADAGVAAAKLRAMTTAAAALRQC